MKQRRSSTRAALIGSVALAAITCASPVMAAGSADEDARIAKLEAAVASLQAQVQAQSGVAAENAALKDQVSRLQSEVGALKATAQSPPPAETQTISAAPAAPAVAKATFHNGALGIASADGRFSATLYGLVQLDAAHYIQEAPGPITSDYRRSGPALGYSSSNVDFAHARNLKDGDEFRRARFGVFGNAFGDFQYRLLFDFGGPGVENAGYLYEAWGQYSGLKPFTLRIGAFAPQEGLADQDPPATHPLIDRPANQDIARNLGGGDSRTAAQIFANGDHWLVSGAVTGRTVGQQSSASTGVAQTYGDQLAFVGRLAGTPFYGDSWLVHLGVHGTYVATPADTGGPPNTGISPVSRYTVSFSDTPELRVDATKLINTGNIDARHADTEGAEFAAQWKNFLLQSEYDYFRVERAAPGVSNPHFQGGYVEGSWILTGESRRYNSGIAAFDAPTVRHPVGVGGGIGVVELALRYSDMDLNYDAGAHGTKPAASAIRGGDMQIFTAGINWYFNQYLRMALEGQIVKINRLSPDATIYQTPVGAQIGQRYDTIALRSQLTF